MAVDKPELHALWETDPAAIRTLLFTLLEQGAASRHSPLHTLTLATVTPNGLPAARTVVFRAIDAAERTVRIHTDVRSPKVAELLAQPHAILLWYAPEWKLQVRMPARFAIHHQDAVTEAAWRETHVRSRRVYNTPNAPGVRATTPLSDIAPQLQGQHPTAANTAPGYVNFAVLVARFDTIEWLTLSSDGNRRGELHWSDDEWHMEWLAP
jgi:pyridoxine/pyridoxamine 5'-phosphate oxidase